MTSIESELLCNRFTRTNRPLTMLCLSPSSMNLNTVLVPPLWMVVRTMLFLYQQYLPPQRSSLPREAGLLFGWWRSGRRGGSSASGSQRWREFFRRKKNAIRRPNTEYRILYVPTGTTVHLHCSRVPAVLSYMSVRTNSIIQSLILYYYYVEMRRTTVLQ